MAEPSRFLDRLRENGHAPAKPVQRVPVPATFFRNGRLPEFVLFDAAGGLVDPHATDVVRLSPGDLDALRRFLLDEAADWLRDGGVRPRERAWAAQYLLRGVASELLLSERPIERLADDLQRATSVLAITLRGERSQRVGLCSLIEVPEPLLARALDTAVLAAALAVEDGEQDGRVLADIAAAGLLADVSFARMPRLAGIDPQSPDPAAVRNHPLLSQELLRRAGIGSPVVHQAVASHHERWDGRGYPRGVAGDRIPRHARYLAIAEGCSQQARARGDRGAFSLDALRAMLADPGRYDPALLRLFARLVADAHASWERRTGGAGAPTEARQAS